MPSDYLRRKNLGLINPQFQEAVLRSQRQAGGEGSVPSDDLILARLRNEFEGGAMSRELAGRKLASDEQYQTAAIGLRNREFDLDQRKMNWQADQQQQETNIAKRYGLPVSGAGMLVNWLARKKRGDQYQELINSITGGSR